MPLYEYECQACGNQLEAQQRMADAPLVTCPSCGKDQLQKIISATAFHLKGGGWYKDLYSSAKPGSSGDSGGGVPTSGAANKSESKSEGKSESKSSDGKSEGKSSEGKPESKSEGKSTTGGGGATSKSESSGGSAVASGGGSKTTAS